LEFGVLEERGDLKIVSCRWCGVLGILAECVNLKIVFMGTVKRFEDLEIWQLARVLENKMFEETKRGRLAKDFSLKSQMNRASGSLMDNIAEGFGRGSRLEFVQFLSIANGSGNELQSQLYRCLDRGYLSKEKFEELYELADSICRKTSTLIGYLNKTDLKGKKFANRKTLP
jgi:four helix bundle protein